MDTPQVTSQTTLGLEETRATPSPIVAIGLHRRLFQNPNASPGGFATGVGSIGSPVAFCHWKPSFIASKELTPITPPGCLVTPLLRDSEARGERPEKEMSAVERARTSKVFLPLAPQASASANFATTARWEAGEIFRLEASVEAIGGPSSPSY